jgi:hypothetical protein
MILQRLIDFGSLPFNIGPKPQPSNEEFPDSLPFCAAIRSDCSLLVQLPNQEVSDWYFCRERY